MSLQNAQAEFAEILLAEDESADLLLGSQNMSIYRNNVTTNLLNALQTTYAMITKLVGEDFFRIAAKEYIHLYPSRSGNLHDYGEYFSDFLAAYPPVKNLPYLAEVAEFEWACHTLQFAADHPPLDLNVLAHLSPNDYNCLNFTLHPAAQLIKFHYPMLRIIDLCEGKIDEEIDLQEGGVNLLIVRRHLDMMFLPLNTADFTFLNALQNHQTLADALEAALLIDAEFKLEERLSFWIQDKIIVGANL